MSIQQLWRLTEDEDHTSRPGPRGSTGGRSVSCFCSPSPCPSILYLKFSQRITKSVDSNVICRQNVFYTQMTCESQLNFPVPAHTSSTCASPLPLQSFTLSGPAPPSVDTHSSCASLILLWAHMLICTSLRPLVCSNAKLDFSQSRKSYNKFS